MTKPDLQSEAMQAVLRRVEKLMAIAEGTANEHESAAAAMMAAKIMAKYQIENEDVIRARMKDKAEFVVGEVFIRGEQAKIWRGWLASSMHYLFEVNIAQHRATEYDDKTGKRVNGIRYLFKGFKDDVALAQYVFQALLNRIEYERLGARTHGIAQANSFRAGASVAILRRAKKVAEERAAEAAGKSEGTSLVIYKGQQVAAHFGEQTFRHVNTGSDDQFFAKGKAAGSKMELGQRGVEGGGVQAGVKRLA